MKKYIISVPPRFIDSESSPSHVSVTEGSDVNLECRAEGTPPPTITWTREDNRPLSTPRGPKGEIMLSIHNSY